MGMGKRRGEGSARGVSGGWGVGRQEEVSCWGAWWRHSPVGGCLKRDSRERGKGRKGQWHAEDAVMRKDEAQKGEKVEERGESGGSSPS